MVYHKDYKISLEKAKSKDAAELLVIHMSNISEDHYCAGWLMGLEYKLWDVLNGGDPQFGFGPISPQNIERLRELHERAGGWWMWVGENMDSGKVFVTTEEWKEKVKNELERLDFLSKNL